MRLTRILALTCLAGTAACGLLVSIGDHHLRDDGANGDEGSDLDAVTADSLAAGDTSSPKDASHGDAKLDAGAETSSPPVVVASSRLHPSTIAMDSNAIYWVEEEPSGKKDLLRLGREDGGTVTTLFSNRANLVGLVGDPRVAGFFFTDDVASGSSAGLFRFSRGMGIKQFDDLDGFGFGALSAPDRAFSVAADPAGGVRIRSSDISGSPVNPNFGATCFVYETTAATSISAMIADGNYVWFADTSSNAILRVPVACGDNVPALFAAGQSVRAFAKSSQNIYWITSDGAVRHLAKASPGTTPFDHATGRNSLAGIDVRGSDVFYTDEGDGTVWRANGTTHELLASGQGGPSGIIAGPNAPDTAVAWTNHDTGQIMYVATP